ncbi:hypothetical protein HK097_004367, partial [Rhizophlyctis rosea]
MDSDLNAVLDAGAGQTEHTDQVMTDAQYDGDSQKDARDVKERVPASNGRSQSPARGGASARGGGGYGSREPYVPRGGIKSEFPADKYTAPRRDPSRPSRRECRVYVGNLAYEVGWQDLKDFMRKAGDVVFADILTQVGGRSKGCGVVEFSEPEQAQRAIRELSDTPLLGRPVFIREDREQEAKFGSGPGRGVGGPPGRGGPPGGGYYGDSAGKQVFVGNLPYIVAWQDLKDLFRSAGQVIRADVHEGPDRRSKGTGVVLFETAGDAQHAISMYDGFEWHGRRLEVREDRFGSGGPPPRGGGGDFRKPYGGPRGGYGDARDYGG